MLDYNGQVARRRRRELIKGRIVVGLIAAFVLIFVIIVVAGIKDSVEEGHRTIRVTDLRSGFYVEDESRWFSYGHGGAIYYSKDGLDINFGTPNRKEYVNK